MFSRLFARFIANVSEELLNDLLKALLKEIVLARKKRDLNLALEELQKAINELAIEEMTDETNLINAGRNLVKRVRR